VTERETLRLAPPVVLWWVWVAFVVANVLDYAVQGLPSARFGAVVSAILLFVTGLAYTLALRPRVIIAGDGPTVVNPYRTHFVPWRLVTLVDTGEWVRVHYTPAPEAGASGASSAGGKTVHCWALYVSARARRKIAAGPPRPSQQRGLLGLGLGRGRGVYGLAAAADAAGGQASRLPAEARYLASLPPAKAMAVRLDSTADRERARAAGAAAGAEAGPPPRATAAWSWPALAAVLIPALILLAVAIA
jgi:hypothetical protein